MKKKLGENIEIITRYLVYHPYQDVSTAGHMPPRKLRRLRQIEFIRIPKVHDNFHEHRHHVKKI